MALNPYTLYNLYEKGILEYVPTDLMMGMPMGAMMPMNNPYLDMAMQGGLYQNYNATPDMFQSSADFANFQYNQQLLANNHNIYHAKTSADTYNGIGSKSNAGIYNTFNGYGIGTKNTNGIADTFGFNDKMGAQSNNSVMNAFGFSNSQGGLFGKTASVINNTPKIVLGLIAGGIGIAGLTAAFKRGKKPPKASNNTSFWSKLKFWKK